MRSVAAILATALTMPPLGGKAADLVVWWEKGFYTQEDDAVAEVITAFEHKTGKKVEVAFYPQPEHPGKVAAAVAAGQPPDFAFGLPLTNWVPEWALDDQLVELTASVGHFSDLFDADLLKRATLLNGRTGQRALYALPMGRSTNHVHVWNSLLEQAGFTREDIPKEWDAFWSFWCDQVQPAVRRAAGRDDIWGIGLSMSAASNDTWFQFLQFVAAYDADYVTQDGKLLIDDLAIRESLIEAIEAYTTIYRKDCTPLSSVTWVDVDNNKQFQTQSVVMTPNETLSAVNVFKRERPDDYYGNTATIEWPLGPRGESFPIGGTPYFGVVFKSGGNAAVAQAFVRFLVAEGWLAHYLDFSGERILPSMSNLLDQPFWLDPSDPHRMASVMQAKMRPLARDYAAASGNWRHDQVERERVWAKAIHRIVTEGVTPEQAVDEAIARIKQILSK
jgi:multiple sugar transport system substrate-binding protein